MTLPHLSRASLLTLAFATLSTGAVAEEHHHHQSAHVHGEAKLQVAIEGQTAELILQSPAANLLGFEHAPKTAEQDAAMADAREWLTATPLVQTADNTCTITAASVQHEHGDNDGRDHDEHGHKEAHAHDHDHEHEEESSHSDFEVTQRIECDSALMDPLSTDLMTRFPGIEHLSVEWLRADGQGHAEVPGGETEIHLDH